MAVIRRGLATAAIFVLAGCGASAAPITQRKPSSVRLSPSSQGNLCSLNNGRVQIAFYDAGFDAAPLCLAQQRAQAQAGEYWPLGAMDQSAGVQTLCTLERGGITATIVETNDSLVANTGVCASLIAAGWTEGQTYP